MPSWTKEQELAITKENVNIIVSAGAGSGKTAVLTERVIRKLLRGDDIESLLILTFTNAAAKEMKERIRASIKKNNLTNQLEKIDASFITTFDSFALSVVKKYHYLLNINSNVTIADSLVLKFKKIEILDNIFSELYNESNPKFLKLIKDFTIRDDSSIKTSILEIYDKLDLMYDMDSYLNTYINKFFNDSFIDKNILDFLNIINLKKNQIIELLKEIELIADGDFYIEFYNSLNGLINSNTYTEMKKNLDIKLPRLKKGMDDIKELKEKINKIIKELKSVCIYDELEIKNGILETKEYIEIIIYILKTLKERFSNYKNEFDLYDFIDISKLAIKIVLEYPLASLELKSSFKEILVDEYQDTSDLQELFINQISNNNVYMVGDIKQSIYRFRNANPNLFKQKYIDYSNNINGFKIDLLKNFRSRIEVVNNINYIFNYIMDLNIGGADYKNSHQMIFGNKTYDSFIDNNFNYNLEIYNYEYNDKEFSKDEIEAFITLKDIQDKVSNKYLVFDKNNNNLRPITYNDFVILIDKATNFTLYKKIFEANSVNLTIIKDENISGSVDLLILKNVLILIKKMKYNEFDTLFWYSYLSIGRSYLFSLNDDYLYSRLNNKKIDNDIILDKIKEFIKDIDITPIDKLISDIIDKFSFYEKLISVGNIEESIIRLDYLKELSKNLSELGYTYLDLIDYFNKMLELNETISSSLNKDNNTRVKIMTIHKSKGLEYPICYYTGLTSKFNTFDLKKRFFFDSNLGIITPYINNGIKPTIYNILYKNNYLKEDISERIRLFYVALTRAREKMIIVTSLNESEDEISDIVSLDKRLKYNSLASILNSIKSNLINYIKNINLENINLTKDYLINKKVDIKKLIPKTNDILEVVELNNDNLYLEEMSYSKDIGLINKDLNNLLEFGKRVHETLEYFDFLNPNFDNLDSKLKDYFKKLFKTNLFKNITKSINIYKEYEFMFELDNKINHGIIDLMVEYDDYIDIIDYKLKHIEDLAYYKQLLGYKDYIKTKTNKNINVYLYSIIDSRYITL